MMANIKKLTFHCWVSVGTMLCPRGGGATRCHEGLMRAGVATGNQAQEYVIITSYHLLHDHQTESTFSQCRSKTVDQHHPPSPPPPHQDHDATSDVELGINADLMLGQRCRLWVNHWIWLVRVELSWRFNWIFNPGINIIYDPPPSQ